LKILNRYYSYFFLTLIIGGWLSGCSAERHNPVARLYQNTTARYNAYFLGNERLKALEAEVAAKTIPDYNRLLPIFPVIDSAAAAGMRKELDEIVKKASYPIQKHPNSDWTDDSYLLIGKARFYGREYEDAIKTFKYINSTSKKEETRHEALVWLMRGFVTIEDLESAKAVSDVMKKQFLNQENALLLFLTRAQYHLLRQEIPLTIENLKLAIPLIEQKDEASRIRFILAQLYQQTNQDKLAYRQFSHILRKNPPYELGFQSKLHLGQVTELSNTADLQKINRYFGKLQKDPKNKEYLDKIYYERAKFELKQNKPDLALQNLQQSVRVSTKNLSQKGYAYLLAGQIYYDKMQQYRLAQAYYDSAVQVLPPTAADYAAAAERRDVLNEFANNLALAEREDSLQALALLPRVELDKRLDDLLVLAEEQKTAAALKAADAAKQAASNPTPANSGMAPGSNLPAITITKQPAGGLWYFDNPATIATAQAEFARRWGNRRLQDNWRTSNQQPAASQPELAVQNPNSPAGNASEAAGQQEALRASLLKNIPLSPEQKTASNERLEAAYFALANIYRLQLKEPARAAETYEKLLARFPQSKYAAEAYYTLYLLYRDAQDPKQNQYASLLKQQFPNTRFAKLIDQPDYLVQVSAGNRKVRALYDSAFSLFESQQYAAASQILNDIRQQFPDSDVNDKVAFLGVRITGHTGQPVQFKMALEQFLNLYPASPLAEKARQYLAAIILYESGKLSEAEFDKTHPPETVPAAREPRQENLPPTSQVRAPQPPATGQAVIKTQPKTNTPVPGASQQVSPTPEPPKTTAAPSKTTAAPSKTNPPAANPATITSPDTVKPAITGNPPPAATPAKPKFADVNLQAPHVVVIAYPKDQAAFAGIAEKVQVYNSKYNGPDKLTVEALPLNPSQDLVLVRQFPNGTKARIYVSKQKTPQSPLSKIRGIEFATFVISAENLPVLLQEGKLEEYLTFYKNNY
jgi:outer membrane protein assembly factor BamD (BamD/ComL family)